MTKATRDSGEDVGRGFGPSVAVTKLITCEELKEKLSQSQS